mmetsp:Transcript_23627/g.26208  ORF Transcript_23627/g.26208 Transcript_23627/m.26208 type:complete len:92 (+) Transcript_23627:49-324(+)
MHQLQNRLQLRLQPQRFLQLLCQQQRHRTQRLQQLKLLQVSTNYSSSYNGSLNYNEPTTEAPTTDVPTTVAPITDAPTTEAPTKSPTTKAQ